MESRFETVRTRLEQQYQPMLTEPESGPDQETLKQELEKYETLHQNEPLIRLKAEMLALILTRGRIGIDPSPAAESVSIPSTASSTISRGKGSSGTSITNAEKLHAA